MRAFFRYYQNPSQYLYRSLVNPTFQPPGAINDTTPMWFALPIPCSTISIVMANFYSASATEMQIFGRGPIEIRPRAVTPVSGTTSTTLWLDYEERHHSFYVGDVLTWKNNGSGMWTANEDGLLTVLDTPTISPANSLWMRVRVSATITTPRIAPAQASAATLIRLPTPYDVVALANSVASPTLASVPRPYYEFYSPYPAGDATYMVYTDRSPLTPERRQEHYLWVRADDASGPAEFALTAALHPGTSA
jgi:hypothetical protein